ncbi:hypothetical protein F66182_12911, partial [Fusarium sp. NRRL 66182]
MQSLRVAVRQHEAQIQHDLMNISDQNQPQPQAQQHPQEDADHPVFRLLDVYRASKSFLATDHHTSPSLESAEMTELMHQLDAKYYVEIYFSHFHGQWPFLSRPQFNPETEPPILVLAMVTSTYQAILLFAIFALTAEDYTEVFASNKDKNEDGDNDDEGGEAEEDVLDRIYPIFTRLVDTCRVQRLLHYPSMLSQIHADDPLVFKFNASEEFKYFALTLFK